MSALVCCKVLSLHRQSVYPTIRAASPGPPPTRQSDTDGRAQPSNRRGLETARRRKAAGSHLYIRDFGAAHNTPPHRRAASVRHVKPAIGRHRGRKPLPEGAARDLRITAEQIPRYGLIGDGCADMHRLFTFSPTAPRPRLAEECSRTAYRSDA